MYLSTCSLLILIYELPPNRQLFDQIYPKEEKVGIRGSQTP